MSEPRTFAIVGAGLAGATAAEALRAEGFDGRIVLLGAEPYQPYERPPLSKEYLQGSATRDTVFVHPPDWYTDHQIELRLDDRSPESNAAGTKLVFTTRYGSPVEPRNFNRSWDARCAKADGRKITVHDGRRSCGTLLADLDVHPRVAMQILRHAQFALTMEIYTLASPKATRDALKRLGDSLGG